MIIPFPMRFLSFLRFPLTMTLAFLNVFIFLLIFDGRTQSNLTSSAILETEGLTLTGRIYFRYLQSLSPEDFYKRPRWTQNMNISNSDQMAVLGSYALRDSTFINHVDTLQFRGDEIQLSEWKKEMIEFKKMMQEEVLYRFGLSRFDSSPLVWITYQFAHSNWMHLLSNLSFLFVMGIAVESLVGGFPLILIYILGGAVGGLAFLLWDGQGAIPMVGASASISALMAFYALAERKARIRYLYFIAPLPGHYGEIYLPTLLIIPLFLVLDLANLWSTPEGMGGGVAYAAHLGGALLGFLFAVYHRYRPFYADPEPLTEQL